MIRIENISKKFKRTQALENISIRFEKRQIVSIIGPNGSGKTTLIKTILGMIHKDTGAIFFNNDNIEESPSYRSKIGYMPQIGRYPDNMKVGQLFKLLKELRKNLFSTTDEELIAKFNLAAMFEKPMSTLSGGTRQKVSAALAFLFNPEVLILDEPTAGLDLISSEILKEKILKSKTENKLVLITSHILSDLEELATHVLYLQDGKVKFFKPREQLQAETSEHNLCRAITKIIKSENFEEVNRSIEARIITMR